MGSVDPEIHEEAPGPRTAGTIGGEHGGREALAEDDLFELEALPCSAKCDTVNRALGRKVAQLCSSRAVIVGVIRDRAGTGGSQGAERDQGRECGQGAAEAAGERFHGESPVVARL